MRALAFALALLALAPAARADEPAPPARGIDVAAELYNLFLFRNDSDFDRTPPTYDENGQTVGVFATVFSPTITWRIERGLRIVYQAELGLNYWSKQNPDEQDATAPDVFVLKHRQIYGEIERGRLSARVGYARFIDPTGLFLNHWIGVADVGWALAGDQRIGVFLGQLPDSTYEGLDAADNNFARDITVAGVRGRVAHPHFFLDAMLTGLLDRHVVARGRWLVAPSVSVAYAFSGGDLRLDAVAQLGRLGGTAVDGGDQTLLAYAAQGSLRFGCRDGVELVVNALAESPDDAVAGNGRSYAFFSSGKSRSSTIMLTEDETRDWYDNLDERMATFDGGFHVNRAGLLVADARLTFAVSPTVHLAGVLGGATVLLPSNALDHTLVGVEADAIADLDLSAHSSLRLVIGGLLPGAAGAALVNHISRTATDPIFMTEAALVLSY